MFLSIQFSSVKYTHIVVYNPFLKSSNPEPPVLAVQGCSPVRPGSRHLYPDPCRPSFILSWGESCLTHDADTNKVVK